MKQDIHPEYHQIEATCGCGAKIPIGTVLPQLKVEICHQCHPFFTGEQKILDTEGRVEKFQKRYAKAKKN